MMKEYMKPEAEFIEFNYNENVAASGTGTGAAGGISYETTDNSNDWWECHTRYADAADVCGQDGHENSNPFWRCNTK